MQQLGAFKLYEIGILLVIIKQDKITPQRYRIFYNLTVNMVNPHRLLLRIMRDILRT